VFGSPADGGDQFAVNSVKGRLENLVVMPAKQLLLRNLPAFQSLARRTKKMGYEVFGDTEEVVRSGNWHGNDTVWRMSLDLNRILLYGNPDGSLRPGGSRKRYFSVVDGSWRWRATARSPARGAKPECCWPAPTRSRSTPPARA